MRFGRCACSLPRWRTRSSKDSKRSKKAGLKSAKPQKAPKWLPRVALLKLRASAPTEAIAAGEAGDEATVAEVAALPMFHRERLRCLNPLFPKPRLHRHLQSPALLR